MEQLFKELAALAQAGVRLLDAKTRLTDDVSAATQENTRQNAWSWSSKKLVEKQVPEPEKIAEKPTPTDPVTIGSAETKPPAPKKRGPKAKKPKAEKPPLPIDPEFAELTEAASAPQVTVWSEKVCDKWPEDGDLYEGVAAPVGFHKCFAILKEHFGGKRILHLTHPERLQFMTKMKALLGPSKIAHTTPSAGEGNDPNAGV